MKNRERGEVMTTSKMSTSVVRKERGGRERQVKNNTEKLKRIPERK